MSAILFGSISTLADTSELQRQAFNDAFEAYGLDWEWSRDDYASMLGSNGGAQRIEDYAASRGVDVDAAAVHAKKSEIFQELLGSSSSLAAAGRRRHGRGGQAQRPRSWASSPRPRRATSTRCWRRCSRTSAPRCSTSSSTVTRVSSPKPDPDVYEFALEHARRGRRRRRRDRGQRRRRQRCGGRGRHHVHRLPEREHRGRRLQRRRRDRRLPRRHRDPRPDRVLTRADPVQSRHQERSR